MISIKVKFISFFGQFDLTYCWHKWRYLIWAKWILFFGNEHLIFTVTIFTVITTIITSTLWLQTCLYLTGISKLKGMISLWIMPIIHTHVDIQKFIKQRGYGCIYLPPYSPELNPIEQFWSVWKSKLKKRKDSEGRNIDNENRWSMQYYLLSNLQGFCRYSESKLQDCLDEKPF